MEKDIQQIKISIARIETTIEFMKQKLDLFPICKYDEVKESVNTNRKLIWVLLTLLLTTAGFIIKNSII